MVLPPTISISNDYAKELMYATGMIKKHTYGCFNVPLCFYCKAHKQREMPTIASKIKLAQLLTTLYSTNHNNTHKMVKNSLSILTEKVKMWELNKRIRI